MLEIKCDHKNYKVSVDNRCYAFEKGKKKEILHLILNDFPEMTDDEFDTLCMFFAICAVACK